MRIPAHFQKQKLDELLRQLNNCHDLYVKREFSFERDFKIVLTNTREYYKLIAAHKNETEVCKLRTYYETSLKGINPEKLEKVVKGRRETAWIGGFHALMGLSGLVQDDIAKTDQTIEEASEVIKQILLSATQASILSSDLLTAVDTLEKVEKLWAQLSLHESYKTACQRLKLTINEKDIYIIADEIIGQIK